MARAWTTQFIAVSGGATTRLYTVPNGMRAVIRNVHVANTAAGSASAFLYLGGVLVWTVSGLAQNAVASLDTHLVQVAGQSFQFNTSGAGCCTCASGYLFEDTPGLQLLPSPEPEPPFLDLPYPPEAA